MDTSWDRREFIVSASAAALTGCTSGRTVSTGGGLRADRPARAECPHAAARFHVFSKMFQPPVTKSPEALCELFAAAGYDGVQWTVRKGGHATPENARAELPRLVKVAESFGLKCESICTGITSDGGQRAARPTGDGRACRPATAADETILKTAADCGIRQFRTGYYFYDEKTETFAQSMERFKRSFAALAAIGERCGIKAAYQNHSTWGPAIFGAVVWDLYEVIRDLDPRWIGIEYDPMHAYFETYESWRHGFELVAPWVSAIDLKDFHYRPDPKNAKRTKKAMVAAGEGIVPWGEVARRVAANGVDPLYILHFEYDFDKTDLPKTVNAELSAFKSALA